MADFFIGEIRMFGFTSVVPKGWAKCDGSSLPVNQNAALYSLLGTNFGGNPPTTFNLPDLRGRVPLDGYASSQYTFGIKGAGGAEAVTLTLPNIPPHNHAFAGRSEAGTAIVPGTPATPTKSATANFVASSGKGTTDGVQYSIYAPLGTLAVMAGDSLGNAGGSAPHNNMQPSLALQFCIATSGMYPMRP